MKNVFRNSEDLLGGNVNWKVKIACFKIRMQGNSVVINFPFLPAAYLRSFSLFEHYLSMITFIIKSQSQRVYEEKSELGEKIIDQKEKFHKCLSTTGRK